MNGWQVLFQQWRAMTKKQTTDNLVKKWRGVIAEASEQHVLLDREQVWNMVSDFEGVGSHRLNSIVLHRLIQWKHLTGLTEKQANDLLREITNFIYN